LKPPGSAELAAQAKTCFRGSWRSFCFLNVCSGGVPQETIRNSLIFKILNCNDCACGERRSSLKWNQLHKGKGFSQADLQEHMETFANWIALAETEAARLAVERVADCVGKQGPRRAINPLFLYGPSGSGKSHLVSALLAEVTQRSPNLQVALVAAGDFEALVLSEDPPAVWGGIEGGRKALRQADVLILEDVQHLSARVEETFVHLIDRRLARGQQLVFTALVGPAQLSHLPTRVTSRLGSGLVVGLGALSPEGRRTFLQECAKRRGLQVEEEILAWLAEHLTGSARQLQGAVARLAELMRLAGRTLSVQTLAEHFRVEEAANRPTVERIVQRVGHYFQIEPQQLQARSRRRGALLPRQIGMYLARQLTELSLQQIGAYFGGRDHSTVLHACRKVERALAHDVHLSGAVRQLHADLA
jgi:chromosomal replication initiator protein